MLDRSAGSLYLVAAGFVILFYIGPYRSATTRVGIALNAVKVNRSAIAEDRVILQRVASLNELQRRVQKALHSPLQVVWSGADEASFLERLRSLSRRNGITITSVLQGGRKPADRGNKVLASQPIRIAATGGFARMLEFLDSLESTVGLVDLDRIEMHPLQARNVRANAGVQVQLDGMAIRFNHSEER